ncbi:sensor histidine kinase [Streptomyces aidingensis]|uniref:histidine kinase n=1 Tax=Streptomyces aidingensis TaxID=910347 RepID=A0A1I1MAU5_9ACTN|nr:histidine kinase [Streptomyces aidingensis]SFC80298.1 Histidine kinase [Streptomyces aidingensis]
MTRLRRRWAHLLLGAALCLPYYLLTLAVLVLAVPGDDGWRDPVPHLLALAVSAPLIAACELLLDLRLLQIRAARALSVGSPQLLPLPAEGRAVPDGAARRRTAVWNVIHLEVGALAGAATVIVPPLAAVLLAVPFVPGLAGSLLADSALPAALAPAAGLSLLAGLLIAVGAAGGLLARLAPPLLGPTAADRLAEAERLAAGLAARCRLGLELHHSVVHSLGAVASQAATARKVLGSDPAFVRSALSAIEQTSLQAVAELGTLLGLLRDGEEAGTGPAPTLAELPDLLDGSRAAGLRVRLERLDAVDRLPGAISREGYRIVQEGLSSLLRHARDRPVRLTVAADRTELTITIENAAGAGGVGALPRPGGDPGLDGVAERVALLGGAARWGTDNGRWRLFARLPLQPRPAAGPDDTPAAR